MNKKNENTKFMYHLVASYSTLLIIILIMGVYLYNLFIDNARSEIRKQNKIVLENSIREIDRSFMTMDTLASQIAGHSSLIRLGSQEDNMGMDFYLLASKIKTDLSVYIPTETLLPIRSYYLYLQQTDYMLSYSHFATTRGFYNSKLRNIEDLYEKWIEMVKDSGNLRKFLPLAEYKETSKHLYLYMLPLKNFSLRDIQVNICFEIDLEKIDRLFSGLNFFETGYLCVTDEDNNVVFALTTPNSKDILVEDLKGLNYKEGFSDYNLAGKKMFVTSSSSSYNQWHYYLVQPKQESLYSLETFSEIFITIIIFAVIIGFFLILFLSKRNIKPIIQLGAELENTLISQNSLKNMVEAQKPIIESSYLGRIIHGGISSPKELEYAQSYLNMTPDTCKFTVLSIVLYINNTDFTNEEGSPSLKEAKYHEDIIEAIQEFFGDTVPVLNLNDREYALLLSASCNESDEDSTSVAEAVFMKLHGYLMEKYSIWIIGGIGNWSDSLMTSWKSYQQAKEAVNYATQKKSFRSFRAIQRNTSLIYYPSELAGQLTNFITIGNDSQVREIFEIIRVENMEQRTLPLNMMKCLLTDIRNTLFKIRFSIQVNEKIEEDMKVIDDMFEQHLSLKLCEDIALLICQLYGNKSSRNELITTIKHYIKENYNDASLCLNKISNEFEISESYFSFLFKEATGENFSSYLENIRMECALKLIREGSVNLSDLYQEVGYNNPNTFRRVFKKVYGVSPKTMRDNEVLKQ